MHVKLPFYIHCFTHLRRDSKNGGAPHKPILILSIINLFNQRIYNSREIEILPELVSSFKNNWSQLVETNHHPIFSLPFYHMNSEPFWELIPNIGCEKWIKSKGSMRGFNNLTTAVKFALIDKDLADILQIPGYRDILKLELLGRYFPLQKDNYVENEGDSSCGNLLHETSEEYKNKIIKLKKSCNENSFEEEIFVRGGVFKREIPKIYNNTCAISGLRIDATANLSIIDACHIVPFSEAYDDSIQNGIALCPNLHRAFDRGLISISDDFRVLIQKNFVENHNSVYNISQFENKKIALPYSPKNHPSLENLYHHRKRFSF